MITTLFAVWALVAVFLIAAWPRLEHARAWRIAAVGAALALSAAHQLMFDTLAEDAFISFRYAMNLADGNGLVFNVGERVEGYSNLSWVLLLAGGRGWFGWDIVIVARIAGVVCTLGCALVGYLLARRITGSVRAGALGAVLVAASSGLAAYGPSGLETPLFALLVLGVALCVHIGQTWIAGLLVGLAAMTRPDGVVIAMVVGVWLIVRLVRHRVSWTAPVGFLATAAAVAVPWTAWRLAYYGQLVPNAIAAKSGADAGWLLEAGVAYLIGFAVAAQALLVLVPVTGYWLLRAGRDGSTVWLLLSIATVYTGFFVATGGDWMPAWRFFAPVLPLFAVAVSAAWALADRAGLPSRLGPVAAIAVSGLLLVTSVWSPNMRPAIDVWHRQVDQLAETGDWLRANLPRGTVIAAYANGALSYRAGPGLTVVDMLGLTDEHIARHGRRDDTKMIGHQAYDYDYLVNRRRPEVMVAFGGGFVATQSCQPGKEFADTYEVASFRVQGQWTAVLVRKDRAAELIRLLDRDKHFTYQPCPRS